MPIAMGHPARTILLLEDDRTISRLLCLVLRRRGYTVLEASDSSEAIRTGQLHERAVDLLLCDVVLDNETAVPAVAGLRKLCPDARVLFLSGFGLDDLLRDGLLEPGMMADGSAFFLQKPFLPDLLLRAVESVLAGEGVPDAVYWRSEEVAGSVQDSY
jgi:CheY-like chemotaxis protein